MSFSILGELPNSMEVKELYKLSDEALAVKKQKDSEIRSILDDKANKILLIIGPCSIENADVITEYANKLANIQKEVEDKILIVLRAYTAKPRTSIEEYKGIVHTPNLLGNDSMIKGIERMREVHTKIINETKLPIADELLYVDLFPYMEDTVSYLTIGARSSDNQHHKQIASGLNIPVGVKNPLNGNLINIIKNVKAIKIQNHCIYDGKEIVTSGNEYAHVILRGYQDHNGKHHSNYNLEKVKKLIEKGNVDDYSPKILIDCSHSNSKKDYRKQYDVVRKVLSYVKKDKEIRKHFKGFMIESYLEEGKQKITQDMRRGQSITDACIGIDETRKIINYIYKNIM